MGRILKLRPNTCGANSKDVSMHAHVGKHILKEDLSIHMREEFSVCVYTNGGGVGGESKAVPIHIYKDC